MTAKDLPLEQPEWIKLVQQILAEKRSSGGYK